MGSFAADDFDSIHERLKTLHPCPTAQALGVGVDVQWYEKPAIDGVTPEFAYRPVSERARPYFKHCMVGVDRYIHWISVDPTELRQRLTIPAEFAFEEVPRP